MTFDDRDLLARVSTQDQNVESQSRALIEHTKTKARHPQTNGICERFHKTVLNEFYQSAFRKKLYTKIEDLQADLDEWLEYYNERRTHQGKICNGRTPMETFIDGIKVFREKSWQRKEEMN